LSDSASLIGRTLSHYRVTAAIGAGGMGEVYRATDTKLGRDVALKVLPAEMARDPNRLARFQREARAVAALNHPHIVTIFSVEQADGVHFLTMELVEGQSLDRLIPASGLPIERIVEIASSLAAALAAAHEKSIVHRDLKPANVMLTSDGRVKVLDFGLAKEIRTADMEEATLTSDGQTQAGAVMGTPAYMSPEEVSGDVVDHRTDIFSMGILLYEMATGQRPFQGRSTGELASAILRDTPRAITELRPNLPADLARIIRRCLEKDPRQRVQTARDVGNELREMARQSPPVEAIQTTTELHPAPEAAPAHRASGISRRKIALAISAGLLVLVVAGIAILLKNSRSTRIDSIAVLPLENRSTDPDADYISEGITESINNSLARLSGLKVIPHSVASHYKGKAIDVQKVGEELRVQAVLTGRVGQRGDNLTVGVELDDVRDGKQLWGQQYNRKLADLLAVQNEIAREVSQRLRLQLSAEDQQKLTKGSTDNPEAYQLYLKGRYYTNKLSKDGFAKGIEYINQAIALDPNYGLAYSGLAYNYINQIDWFMPPSEAGPKARAAAERALSIDESSGEAHLSRALVAYWYEWDWTAAEREFRRAIELNPNSFEAHGSYSWFLAPMGRKEEAVAEAKRCVEADPLSGLANGFAGSVSVFTRQWDTAIEQLRGAIELDPNFWFNHEFLGRAYQAKGRLADAIVEYQRSIELEKDNAELWSNLGHAYAISGKRSEAQKVLEHLNELSVRGYVAPYNIAVVYAGLGENDKVFALLDQAYKSRSYYFAVAITTDDRLDSLRSDPRFVDLLRRIGHEAVK